MIAFSLVKLLIFALLMVETSGHWKIAKCLKTPDTWKKVDGSIKECQEVVKLKIIKETFHSNEWTDVIFNHDYENYPWKLPSNLGDHEQHPPISEHLEIHNPDHHTSIQDHYPSIPYHHTPHHEASSGDHLPIHHNQPPETFDFPLNDHSTHQNEAPHPPERFGFPLKDHSSLETHQIEAPQTHQSFVHSSVTPNNDQTDHPPSDNPVEPNDYIDFNEFRKKRHTNSHNWIHPATVTYHDKRIAGCIMQCIYEKNNAVDRLGWPTLDGLVNFYSEGVNEHGYFMATLRAVDYCLKGSSAKYHVNRRSTPESGQACDVAFDVFDCISDRITEYCSDDHHSD